MSNIVLLIDIDRYKDRSEPHYCVQDVGDFRGTLIEQFEFDEENVTEVFYEAATNEYIQEALKKSIQPY